jgi:hypothetical protein
MRFAIYGNALARRSNKGLSDEPNALLESVVISADFVGGAVKRLM